MDRRTVLRVTSSRRDDAAPLAARFYLADLQRNPLISWASNKAGLRGGHPIGPPPNDPSSPEPWMVSRNPLFDEFKESLCRGNRLRSLRPDGHRCVVIIDVIALAPTRFEAVKRFGSCGAERETRRLECHTMVVGALVRLYPAQAIAIVTVGSEVFCAVAN